MFLFLLLFLLGPDKIKRECEFCFAKVNCQVRSCSKSMPSNMKIFTCLLARFSACNCVEDCHFLLSVVCHPIFGGSGSHQGSSCHFLPRDPIFERKCQSFLISKLISNKRKNWQLVNFDQFLCQVPSNEPVGMSDDINYTCVVFQKSILYALICSNCVATKPFM